jgi:hypothetical protein
MYTPFSGGERAQDTDGGVDLVRLSSELTFRLFECGGGIVSTTVNARWTCKHSLGENTCLKIQRVSSGMRSPTQ